MQKYEIPNTVGATSMCKRCTVILGENCGEGKNPKPLKQYELYWPDSPSFEAVLCDFIDELNDTLEQRGLDLCWYIKSGSEWGDGGISVQGLWWVTNKVSRRSIPVIVDGKTYKIDPDKLEALVKSLM